MTDVTAPALVRTVVRVRTSGGFPIGSVLPMNTVIKNQVAERQIEHLGFDTIWIASRSLAPS